MTTATSGIRKGFQIQGLIGTLRTRQDCSPQCTFHTPQTASRLTFWRSTKGCRQARVIRCRPNRCEGMTTTVKIPIRLELESGATIQDAANDLLASAPALAKEGWRLAQLSHAFGPVNGQDRCRSSRYTSTMASTERLSSPCSTERSDGTDSAVR
jgi:hypothetical protein